MNKKQIIEEVRKEFEIPEREWNNLCFEGSYVPELIKCALRKQQQNLTRVLNRLENKRMTDNVDYISIQMKDWLNFRVKQKYNE